MKKLMIVLMLLIIVSAFADGNPNKRELIYHFAGGLALGSINHVGLSNIKFTRDYAEEWNFYLTTTEIVIEELYSNNWEGVKFWKVTSAVIGMATAKALWDGSRPMIYPKYYGQKNGIGLEFAFQF